MTTITHVIQGVDSEGISHAVLSGCVVLAIGYAAGQCLRGWWCSRRKANHD